MKYASHARELILEVKRNPEGPYNDALVKHVMDEFVLHGQAWDSQVKAGTTSSSTSSGTSSSKLSQTSKPSVLLETAAMERNKRALLLYHHCRMQAIQERYWNSTTNTNTTAGQKDPNHHNSQHHLSPLEQEFAANYEQLIQTYANQTGLCGGWCDNHNSSNTLNVLSQTNMTQRVYVQVRVRDPNLHTRVVLESGTTVSFTPHSIHYLKYSDVQDLIHNGQLQVLF